MRHDQDANYSLPGNSRVLVGGRVSEVWNLARLTADEAVKVGALQGFARGVDEMALGALDLEDLVAAE